MDSCSEEGRRDARRYAKNDKVSHLDVKEQTGHFSHRLRLTRHASLGYLRGIRLGFWGRAPEELHGVEIPHSIHLHPCTESTQYLHASKA